MFLCVIVQGAFLSNRLALRLAEAGFTCQCFENAVAAGTGKNTGEAKAILIDQAHDDAPLTNVVSALRDAGLSQPLVVLAARDDWRERVASYQAGADAVLVKPVHSEEVAACLARLVSARHSQPGGRLAFGDIEIDIKARCAWRAGVCLNLTRNEFRLLQCLFFAEGRFMTKRQLIDSLWLVNRDVGSNAVEVLISRLRAKLGRYRILSARGLGYRLVLGPMADEPQFATEPCSNC